MYVAVMMSELCGCQNLWLLSRCDETAKGGTLCQRQAKVFALNAPDSRESSEQSWMHVSHGVMLLLMHV